MARTLKGLDAGRFDRCLSEEMSLGRVYQDEDLGHRNGVEATPTLFINGERMNGIAGPAQLIGAITTALESATSHAGQTASSNETAQHL